MGITPTNENIHHKHFVLVQDAYSFRAPVRNAGAKQVSINNNNRGRRGKNKQLPDVLPIDEAPVDPVTAPTAAARFVKFAERLHDAQRIEDLFEASCYCIQPDDKHQLACMLSVTAEDKQGLALQFLLCIWGLSSLSNWLALIQASELCFQICKTPCLPFYFKL